MDALKKAEQAKHNAASQPGSEPVAKPLAPSLVMETLADEEGLQPTPELLKEAEQDAQLLAIQAETATETEPLKRQYAYEWVDDLDLLEEKNPFAIPTAPESLVLPEETENSYKGEWSEELHLLDIQDTSPPAIKVTPEQANTNQTQDNEELTFLLEDEAKISDTSEAEQRLLVETTPTTSKITHWLEEIPEPQIEPSPAPPSAPLDWLDAPDESPSPAESSDAAHAQARLAAAHLLQAEQHRLHKKPSQVPILLGFLLLIGAVLGGAYYVLSSNLLSTSASSSLLTPEMQQENQKMQAEMAETGCKTLGCLRQHRQAQEKPAATQATVAASPPVAHEPTAVAPKPEINAVTPVEKPSPLPPQTTVAAPSAKVVAPPATTAATPSATVLAQQNALADVLKRATPAAVTPSTPAEPATQRPQGKFFEGLTRYELQQLADKGFVINRQVAPPTLQTQLNEAYQAYQTGKFATAAALYQKVLQQQPKNRDALLGMAALAQQDEQTEPARAYYAQVLQWHPGDAVAETGLLNLTPGKPAADQEQQLRERLAQQPKADWLHFALGNLYSRQNRWREAEEAYFQAYHNAPQQPDYAYNLAVSLEHLQKPRSALGFYEEALQQIEKGAKASFATEQVRQRITQLRTAD